MSKFAILLLLYAAAALRGSAAFAGIVVINQSRDVLTSGPNIDQTDTATPFAPFNDSISKSGSYLDPIENPPPTNYTAKASQNSIITSTTQTLHISASGAISFSIRGESLGNNEIVAQSDYSVTFKVTTPAQYTVVEQTDHQTGAGNSDIEAESKGASLFSGSQELIPVPLSTAGDSSPQTFTGTLAPGTYTFEGRAEGNDFVSSDGKGSFSADLTVKATGTSAVPLPAAFWMAILTIGAVCLVKILSRKDIISLV